MAMPQPKSSPAMSEAQKVKGQIDTLISKMHKQNSFTPTRNQLDDLAEELMNLINRHHNPKTAPFERYLKTAIIDLTEVPQMAPEMQRISFMTALKDASKNVDQFLNSF